MKLNNTQVKNAKPLADKAYKLFDGGGLFLQINKNGSKYWRLKYRLNNKEKLLSIGTYPQVSIKQARKERDNAKELIAQGIDPSAKKQHDKQQSQQQQANTFQVIATRWHQSKADSWTQQHAKRIMQSLEQRVFPFIGDLLIEQVTAPQILKLLRKMEAEGLGESTRRVKRHIERVFVFAIAEGKATHNPAIGLQEALKTQPKVKHSAYLVESEMPAFLQQLEDYQGHHQIKLAFQFLILTFVRTKELRLAEWEHFDLDKKQWVLPKEVMKMDEPHIVPLSKQALNILAQLRELNGNYRYVFAGIRNQQKPMSENTLIYALYRMGYKSRATVHGFRATASTILNENGFNADWIERQLSHGEPNSVRAAYNHAEYLKERTKMMQWYADKIENLRESQNVVVANFHR